MDADQLLAFNVRTRKIVATIPAPGVHGVIAVPQLGRVYASATNAREVLTINAHTEKALATAPAGDNPDGLAYDPVNRHVFISDESGGIETVITASGHRLATVQLGGEAGNVQYDAGSGHMLVDVDVQAQSELGVIDPDTNKIIRRVTLPSSCSHAHGLLVDPSRRLAFIACDANAKLITFDLKNMAVIGIANVGQGPDVLAFDPGLRRLYIAAEGGVVAVFSENGRHLRKLGQAFLATEAHTVAVDPRTHLVYFPLQQGSTGGPQLLIMKPAPVSSHG
jgi:DNA-binding beta-propeller fold protein YncE